MKYGLIGEKLGHSYSKVIHEALGLYEYELKELPLNEVESFIKGKEYKGLNVTIPYKETVMPFLDYIDDGAKAIGAVNTIVNRDGKLYGYNTDFYGLKSVLLKSGFDFKDKKVLVLGTGGTSKTARAVLASMEVGQIVVVSRERKDDFISYRDVVNDHSDAEFIVNTTPVGMYPKLDGTPISLEVFKNLYGVMDVIYNPGRTKFMLEALDRDLVALGGLYMLVGQAIYAARLFTGLDIPDSKTDEIYHMIRSESENIVLIGMPGSGKSTVGKKLAKELKLEFVDTDNEIIAREGRQITEIFAKSGEKYFRDVESQVVKDTSLKKGVVISTGGGAILRKENVDALKAYGRLFFMDRKPETLVPTDNRPLADNAEKMQRLYKERFPVYTKVADVTIDCSTGVDAEVKMIMRKRNED